MPESSVKDALSWGLVSLLPAPLQSLLISLQEALTGLSSVCPNPQGSCSCGLRICPHCDHFFLPSHEPFKHLPNELTKA